MLTQKNTVLAGVVVLAIIAVGGIAAYIKASFFESGSYLVTEGVEVEHSYRLKVSGTDLRVYEWTPKTAPHTTCIFTSGEHKASLECLPKETK